MAKAEPVAVVDETIGERAERLGLIEFLQWMKDNGRAVPRTHEGAVSLTSDYLLYEREVTRDFIANGKRGAA